MDQKPEIKISKECYQTYPCKHFVKIKYPGGKCVEGLVGAVYIIKFHQDHSMEIPSHFDYLLKDTKE